jgi:septal ring factor EnvC (AmiA/AmiB activator)
MEIRVMKYRVQLVALAATLAAFAMPLRAQEAAVAPVTAGTDSTAVVGTPAASMPAVRTAPIVVTAARVDDRERLLRLQRGNRFLANELRKYDQRVAALESHLDGLKQAAAKREAEIRAIDSQRDAARVERAKLEARLVTLEQQGTTGTTVAGSRGAGGF